ncbi:Hypothetical Protein FCC1311_063641 [Hondaea fermentalgiana]|uniref:Uncharacterized protein n=1 Tax=Hondaea fermentalgiana TaxID=2315210 RepID=A0A2R5GP83_9STRA|nr:Hypothetical Protein FCC1311_063641 [Hondaea fermentalgiana]|eukprot:GBG30131.1 Hypothetical Protein FCC1311_063641 [Hondaea fermentalgiana]
MAAPSTAVCGELPKLDEAPLKVSRARGYDALDVKVYREDTDTVGIVFYRNFLTWFERGRENAISTDFLAGLFEYNGDSFVVTRSEQSFRKPAFYGDELEVRTIPFADGPFRLHFDQSIWRKSDNTLLVAGFVEMVTVSRTFQLTKVPQPVHDLIYYFDDCKSNFTYCEKPGAKKRPIRRKPGAPSSLGKTTELDLVIHLADTDFTGIAFHPNYYCWFERARSDFLSKEILARAKTEFHAVPVVRSAKLAYKNGARPVEPLRITTTQDPKGEHSDFVVPILQKLTRVSNDQTLVEAVFEMCFVHDKERHLVKVPSIVRDAIA